ncbi:hypothetical protein [Cellulomonas sp. URHB0016]
MERVDGGAVVQAVREHVQVGAGPVTGRDPPVVEDEGPGVVEDGVADAGHDAGLQADRAVHAVECADRAAQRAAVLAEPPHRVVRAHPATDCDRQAARAERAPVVHQVQPVRHDLQVPLGGDDAELGDRQVAVQGERRRPVLEAAVRGVFQPQQAVGEDRDPEPVALDHRTRVGDRP